MIILKNKTILLLAIFFVALFIRIWQIQNFPPSLNWDEISLGYNSYSILKTGKDEWGINLPLLFRAYGDYKLPLYIYLSTPFLYLFGLNTISIKLVSILSGLISGIFFYLICKKIFSKSSSIPIIGTLIYLLSPWSVFLSRIALEANLYLCLSLICFYYLISKKYWQSSLFFGLCLFSYNSSRVIFPFYLLSLIILIKYDYKQQVKNKFKYLFFVIASIIFIFQSLNSVGQARYKWVSLIDTGAINRINELRQTYPRLVVNKYTYFIYQASVNYLSHFNPQYIFLKGSSNYQFNIPESSLISILLLPFLVYGIFYIKHSIYFWPIIIFTLISPIPSAITRDAPQILRSITFLPMITLIILFGIEKIKYHKIAYVYVTLAILFTIINFWKSYPEYSKKYAPSWQYGYQQSVNYIKTNYERYQEINITKKYGEPHEFLLFYWPWEPQKYNSQNKIWDYHADWYWVDSFDKFKFINDWEIKDYKFKNNSLLITTHDNYPKENSKYLDSIYYPDGTVAFDIISYD